MILLFLSFQFFNNLLSDDLVLFPILTTLLYHHILNFVLNCIYKAYLISTSSTPTLTITFYFSRTVHFNSQQFLTPGDTSIDLLTLPFIMPYPTQSPFPFFQNAKLKILTFQILLSLGTIYIYSSFFLSGHSHSNFLCWFL